MAKGEMVKLRSALVWAAIDKYFGLALSFIFIAAMSRLLTPREIGISAIGIAVFGVAEAMRDFGATSYIVQRREITLEVVRTCFTILLLSSLALAAALVAASFWISDLYGEPKLKLYIQVLAAGFIAAPFAGPPLALMRRELEFGKLAAINVAANVMNAAVAIALALAGFSYMSFAWAGLAAAFTVPILALVCRPEFQTYRIRLHNWSEAVRFGGYATATTLLNKAYEALPLLILGRVLSFDAVGLLQRALTVCQLPEKFVVAAVAPVALPALSAAARDGYGLKPAYLQAMEAMTAVVWPALVMLAILAYPIVRVLLGPQWIAAAPLVQLMAIAYLMMFPAFLTYPVLVASGAIRDTMWSSLISLPLSLIFLVPASYWGLEAIALSLFVTLPLQVWVALSFIRRHVPFLWSELAVAVSKSVVVTACCAAGPLILLIATNLQFDMPPLIAVSAALLSVPGWILGLWLTSHPLLTHLRQMSACSAPKPPNSATDAGNPKVEVG